MPRFLDIEDIYVSGQAVSRRGREIRAPLPMLHRLLGEWTITVQSHRTSNGTFWFSALMTSRAKAVAIMRRARELWPHFATTQQRLTAMSGGRQ